MSAKELFEELGYDLDIKDNKEILYKMKWEISTSYWVSFDLTLKSIGCFMTSDSPFEPSQPYRVELDLLQAINKQIEELGWLDVKDKLKSINEDIKKEKEKTKED